MKLSITCVDDFLNRSFYKLGLIVGRHPGYFIIIPVLLACICWTGYQRIHYEIDPEYLFSPINGPGKVERAIIESHFKVNYSHHFSLGRITRPGRFGHLILTSKDDNPNILRRAFWDEIKILDQVIQNATVQYEGVTYTYHDLCAKWLDKCFSNDILDIDLIIDDVESGNLSLTFPLMFNPKTFTPYMFPVYFGATEVTEDNIIKSVPSMQLAYFLRVENAHQDAIGAKWEEAFLNAVGNIEDNNLFKHVSTSRFASRTLELEFERNTQTVVPYYTSTFLIICVFSVVTCMMTDWVRSKPWLGFLGNVSAAMATTAAFGLCMYLGVSFIGINLAAPFLMIGIGIDDTFVMLAAWRRTKLTSPVPDRMAHTLSEAAVSITITSLTDMVSFFIGIISPFPSVQIFCIYSGFAVIFTFLFHLTFFSGCVAISGYCEQKNLHSLACCKVQPYSKSTHRSWLYRIFCSGGVDPDDPNNPLDNAEHGCMSFFRDYLAVALNNKVVKAIVLIIFGLYLIGAVYGLTTIKEGLDRRRLSKEDSYSVIFYDREDYYFREYPYRVQVVVNGQYDYSDPVIQQQVENLTLALEASPYISESIYTESWLRSFLASTEDSDLDIDTKTEKGFISALKELLLDPSNAYSLDVKFDEKEEHIVASRFMIQAVNVSGTNQEKEMVKEIRQICADSPLNASVFNPYFVFFDQFELVRPTTIQNMIFGALVMMLISLIFIPNIMCCLWVAFCIVSIEMGVAGYMSLWDVSLDSISMINLIMCIGFSVDFTAHICYAYMSSKKKTPDEKVKDCLYTLGLPVVQGALSTILGLLALLLAGTYIFLVFFKMVFLTIFLGAVHGLFLLPVLLSLFGPDSCDASEKKKEPKELQEDISKLSQPYVIPHPSLYYHTNGITKGSPTISLTAFEERDPGLGTSEDSNSTESGSSQSRRKPTSEAENQQRKCIGWRRSMQADLPSLSQFQANPPPDYPGSEQARVPRDLYLGNPVYYASLQPNIRDYRRSRSQQNLNQPPARYFTDPRYP